jgi:type VI secretion system secreted protein VgrG
MDAPTMFRLSVDGFGPPWVVLRLEGRERIHAAFSFAVTCAKAAPDDAPIDLEALLSLPVRLTWPVGDGSERVIVGVVDRAEAVHSGYRVVVVPRVAELAEVVDHRVFLAMDAVAIAEEVLGTRHLRVEKRLSRPLPARPQTVQFFEGSLEFVSRLLAEEGIAWWLKPGEPDVVVLSDHASGYDVIAGESTLRVAEDAGLFGGEAVARVRVRSSVKSDHVSMRDYDFEHPKLDQTAEAAEDGGRLEVYSYPGGYADPTAGQALARIRLEEARAEHVVLEAETSCRRLVAGHVLTLSQGARQEINQEWLLVEVVHELDGEGSRAAHPRYVARFRAVPASGGYRPARATRSRPRGVQTATITGPAGTEIHTEMHGRVTAQLRWDRRAARDERSSHWMRVAQPPTSGGFLLPRLGWEVLLGFSGSSADAPLVLGRLGNGQAPPPQALPARKVVGAFGSLTTPKGGSANVLRLDDAAGSEGLGVAASDDYNERTENDKVTGVTGTDAHAIGATRTLIVGTVHQVGVAAAQSYTVGGSREVNVNANTSIVAGSESVRVGGARMFTIAGDLATSCGGALMRLVGGAKAEAPIEHQSRSVAGASTIAVGAGWKVAAGAHASVSVLGASIEQVAGPKNIVCGKYNLNVTGALNETMASRSVSAHGDRGEQFGGAASYTIGGAAKLSGSDVIFKATAKITIQAGGTTITLTPGSITIDGEFSGSVASEDHGTESIG